MDDNNSEIRKIRIELQWISWGLVKVPLIALGLFAIYSLLNRSGGDVEEVIQGCKILWSGYARQRLTAV